MRTRFEGMTNEEIDNLTLEQYSVKRWNDKEKRNTGFEDRAGIFQATKLVIETSSRKPLGLEVDQTAKPNQTKLALCLRFLSPQHYQEMFTKGRFYTGGKILTPKYQDMIQKYLTQ